MPMSTWSFSCLIHFCSFQVSKSKLVPERSDESGQAPTATIIIIVIERVIHPGSLINMLPRKTLFLFKENLKCCMGILIVSIWSTFEEDLTYFQKSQQGPGSLRANLVYHRKLSRGKLPAKHVSGKGQYCKINKTVYMIKKYKHIQVKSAFVRWARKGTCSMIKLLAYRHLLSQSTLFAWLLCQVKILQKIQTELITSRATERDSPLHKAFTFIDIYVDWVILSSKLNGWSWEKEATFKLIITPEVYLLHDRTHLGWMQVEHFPSHKGEVPGIPERVRKCAVGPMALPTGCSPPMLF